MAIIYKNFRSQIIYLFPIILLYFLSITEIDTQFSNHFEILSFNLQLIIVYFWTLKNMSVLGNGHVFFAGIINDIVQNFPIGISSINFLLLCAIASFIRARTLQPNLLYDWILFFVAILIISSINYSISVIFFDSSIRYGTLMFNSFITFLIYPIFSKLFTEIYLLSLKHENAE